MTREDYGSEPPMPCFFFSHGTTANIMKKTPVAAYWEEVGRQALAQGVERIVVFSAHWETLNDEIRISADPHPKKQPVPWADPTVYKYFDSNVDVNLAGEVHDILKGAGFDVKLEKDFEEVHDSFMVLKWMFPGGKSLPHVVVSHNARCDPGFHLRMGEALRPLRFRKTLLLGSGGGVHNLYRNNWPQIVFRRDSAAQGRPPEQWAIDFSEGLTSVVVQNSGPGLRRGISRLMSHPQFRNAHGTDEHYIPAVVVAGAAGHQDDTGTKNYVGAEAWELVNLRNMQYQFGDWPKAPHVTPIRNSIRDIKVGA
ncbi:4,5-DOPA dioxygenase extradiol [Vanrija pseudolonga]|uniref:4,5-DOPA dioxygenase extradiol n=1 Tax=Vanrija pseudolonga TaxID=143232 RepID=A0AAF1BNK6_9TREE|nr:4,5-DOPA dioxygenase extradiol [Vanrija pseudolonga]